MIYDFLMEYRVSPIALDTAPRFSWKLKSEGKNVLQIAYQSGLTGLMTGLVG